MHVRRRNADGASITRQQSPTTISRSNGLVHAEQGKLSQLHLLSASLLETFAEDMTQSLLSQPLEQHDVAPELKVRITDVNFRHPGILLS